MDFTDYANNVNKTINELQSYVDNKLSGDINSGLVVQIKERIIETGKNSKGQSYPLYSTGYEKTRKSRGRPIEKRNLSFTGNMWRGTQIQKQTKKGNSTIYTVKGNDKFTQNKINWNSEQLEDDILTPSKNEEQKLVKAIQFEFDRIIKRNNLL